MNDLKYFIKITCIFLIKYSVEVLLIKYGTI
jgi:hypothetical protein